MATSTDFLGRKVVAIDLHQTVTCPFCGYSSTKIFIIGETEAKEGGLVNCGTCPEQNIWVIAADGLKQIRGPNA